MTTIRVLTRCVRIALLLALVACRPADQRTETVDARAREEARTSLSDSARAALDRGSDAFRGRDYQAALRLYRRAAELAPDAAAPWFGVYMAERALGNVAAADSALARARAAAPGASLIGDSVP